MNILERNSIMNNPLFDFFTEHGEKFNDWKEREEAVQKWAWAVPNKEALNAIKRHSPIAEIGCGSGYWAMLLKEMGVDVTAYDQEEDKKQKAQKAASPNDRPISVASVPPSST